MKLKNRLYSRFDKSLIPNKKWLPGKFALHCLFPMVMCTYYIRCFVALTGTLWQTESSFSHAPVFSWNLCPFHTLCIGFCPEGCLPDQIKTHISILNLDTAPPRWDPLPPQMNGKEICCTICGICMLNYSTFLFLSYVWMASYKDIVAIFDTQTAFILPLTFDTMLFSQSTDSGTI